MRRCAPGLPVELDLYAVVAIGYRFQLRLSADPGSSVGDLRRKSSVIQDAPFFRRWKKYWRLRPRNLLRGAPATLQGCACIGDRLDRIRIAQTRIVLLNGDLAVDQL